MKSITLKDLGPAQIQNYLQYAVAPRPIAFVSTINTEGNINLSPFSFFNMFSSNPPMIIFSPARRVRDNTTKHTLNNVMQIKECVVNIVNYDMVQQTSLASTEYAEGINEFKKAGFTELKSEIVKPPRVKESPVQLECLVREIISLGENPGAGNLILAEVVLMHIDEKVLDADGKIDQLKMDHVARLGGDWYCRVTADNLFKVAKPLSTLGMGVDALPEEIRNSKILTGNNLGQLGNIEQLPSLTNEELMVLSSQLSGLSKEQIHQQAKELLDNGHVIDAWKILLVK
jgi:flavin reductase (DIM6/NTAB) family NADH-FMN oxidoreductase RutF